MKKKMGEENTENITEKISQFKKLPIACSACQEPFDKKDKDMVQSWSVVVKQETVRLFCPECIRKTQEILDERR
jgi:Zn finger protein HypA/HybF involved in hydrogenase expression